MRYSVGRGIHADEASDLCPASRSRYESHILYICQQRFNPRQACPYGHGVDAGLAQPPRPQCQKKADQRVTWQIVVKESGYQGCRRSCRGQRQETEVLVAPASASVAVMIGVFEKRDRGVEGLTSGGGEELVFRGETQTVWGSVAEAGMGRPHFGRHPPEIREKREVTGAIFGDDYIHPST